MLPSGSRDHLPFPPVAAWEWRARWAPLKLGVVLAWEKGENVRGPCQCCRFVQGNKQCTFRFCSKCCVKQATSGGDTCRLKSHVQAYAIALEAAAKAAKAKAMQAQMLAAVEDEAGSASTPHTPRSAPLL